MSPRSWRIFETFKTISLPSVPIHLPRSTTRKAILCLDDALQKLRRYCRNPSKPSREGEETMNKIKYSCRGAARLQSGGGTHVLIINCRIITDASLRRFRAQKIYLRATAALRWVNSRNAVLQGQRAHAGHALALQQIRNTLRAVSSWYTVMTVQSSMTNLESGARINNGPKS